MAEVRVQTKFNVGDEVRDVETNAVGTVEHVTVTWEQWTQRGSVSVRHIVLYRISPKDKHRAMFVSDESKLEAVGKHSS